MKFNDDKKWWGFRRHRIQLPRVRKWIAALVGSPAFVLLWLAKKAGRPFRYDQAIRLCVRYNPIVIVCVVGALIYEIVRNDLCPQRRELRTE